jgi:hypothetical protein
MSDRKIHARTPPPKEYAKSINPLVIVRYDRGGKWYIEMEGEIDYPVARRAKPEPVTVGMAATIAEKWESRGGTVYEGTPGGQAFDRKVRTLRQERAAAKKNKATMRAAKRESAK